MLQRSDQFIAFLDHEPLSKGHTLVSPIRHARELGELSDAELVAFFVFVEEVKRILQRSLNPSGFTMLVSEGAVNDLDHLHLHLIPRSPSDGVVIDCPHTVRASQEGLQSMLAELQRASR